MSVVQLNKFSFEIRIKQNSFKVKRTVTPISVNGLENVTLVSELGFSTNKVVNQYGVTQEILRVSTFSKSDW